MKKEKGKILAVFSSKGGVGKTTTVLNLAGVLNDLNKKVLIVDFDLTSGAIATYLNRNYQKSIYTLSEDLMNNSFENIYNYLTKYNDNIYFLPCSKDPKQGVKVSSNQIEKIFNKIVYDFDYILIDMNHNLSEFNVTVLDLASSILLVLTNDLIDLKNTRNLINIFNESNITNYKILLNMSINPFKKYYGVYDIKNIIKANIDYLVDTNFFLKTMDNYIASGEIITMNKKFKKVYSKVNKTYLELIKDLDGKEDE